MINHYHVTWHAYLKVGPLYDCMCEWDFTKWCLFLFVQWFLTFGTFKHIKNIKWSNHSIMLIYHQLICVLNKQVTWHDSSWPYVIACFRPRESRNQCMGHYNFIGILDCVIQVSTLQGLIQLKSHWRLIHSLTFPLPIDCLLDKGITAVTKIQFSEPVLIDITRRIWYNGHKWNYIFWHTSSTFKRWNLLI